MCTPSKLACSSLVVARPHLRDQTIYYVTISPNPSTKVETELKVPRGKYDKLVTVKKKIRYDCLKQSEQVKYCMNHVKDTYMSLCSNSLHLIGTVELNKTGNVHLHLLLQSNQYKGLNGLHELRRDILNCPSTMANLCKQGKDYMNNIVICDDPPKTIAYFDKEFEQNIRDGKYYNYFMYI